MHGLLVKIPTDPALQMDSCILLQASKSSVPYESSSTETSATDVSIHSMNTRHVACIPSHESMFDGLQHCLRDCESGEECELLFALNY